MNEAMLVEASCSIILCVEIILEIADYYYVYTTSTRIRFNDETTGG